ncbi:radical SAM protein [bacterium]|nr:radical SAM protein [bacterium]
MNFNDIKNLFKKNKEKKKYLSCEYIQHGLNADYEDIKMCCFNTHEGGGRQILIPNYNGEKIDWDKFFKEKRKMRELNKQGITLERCKGCFFLKEQEWDDEDYLSWVVFNHWTRCNCKCNYCFTSENFEEFAKRPNYSLYDQIKELVKRNQIRPGGEIGFGGGEPAILDEFEPMVNLLIDAGLDNIRVHSSGIKFSPAMARGISKGILNVVVSPDAGTPETYLKIKNVNAFDKVWENIRKYAEAQTENRGLARTKYIIIPGVNDTYEEIDKWYELTYDAGVRWVVLDVEGGWYVWNKDKVPKHVYELLDYAINKANELNMIRYELYDRARDMINHRGEFGF